MPSPFALVSDDYHEVIQSSLLNIVFCDAIFQIPVHTNLYVLSREHPPKEMTRLRANRMLSLLGWDCLRLEQTETHHIVCTAIGSKVNDELISELHYKTDGWVAGLLLLLKCGETERFELQLLSKYTPQEIFDYFSSELFDKLQPQIQHQLIQFSFLPRISTEMACKITGDDNAGELLRGLHAANMFLMRLNSETCFYQFHPLLRDFLQMKARKILASADLKNLLRHS